MMLSLWKNTACRQLAAWLLGLGLITGMAPTALAGSGFSSEQLQTRLYQRRAVEAALWGMPLVNFDAMRQAYFRDAGAQYNDIMYWSRPSDWKNQTTTPNHSTIYVMFFVNLKDGPLVVDIPPVRAASLYGGLVDTWTTPQINVGSLGQDQGKGARYLLLPPGWEGEVPAGYVAVRSQTNNVYSLLRVITRTTGTADLAAGVDYLKTLKVYPLAEAQSPKANRYLDVADKVYDAIARFDESFYDSLARVVAEEPVQERDLAVMGQLRSLGIGKGLTFQPDAAQRKQLGEAVAEAHAYMMEGYANSGNPLWPQRQWRTLADMKLAVSSLLSFVEPKQALRTDERAFAWFGMFGPIIPPAPHLYLKSYATNTGERLSGEHSYRLHIPAQVPARDFWSVDVYDASTAGFIREAKVVGLDSYDQKLQRNADGSIDLYFAPTPPKGHENNWISTRAGEKFFTLFRVYGLDKQAMVQQHWLLEDIQKL